VTNGVKERKDSNEIEGEYFVVWKECIVGRGVCECVKE